MRTPASAKLTARVAILGAVVGIVPTASSLYLGLKTGWGFGSTFFAILLGYPLLKLMGSIDGNRHVSLQEHCIFTTVVTGVSNITMAGFVNGIPALYKLQLLDPRHFPLDMARFAIWGTALAGFSCFVALNLGEHFIARADLPFPAITGAALLMKQIHGRTRNRSPSRQPSTKAVVEQKPALQTKELPGGSQRSSEVAPQRVLVYCLVGSFVFLLVAHAIPVLKEFHPFWIFAGMPAAKGPHPDSGAAGFFYQMERFSIFFSVSFAFIGAGMMMGMKSSTSFFAGSILGWFVIGRFLIEGLGWVPNPWDPVTRTFASPGKMDPMRPGVGFWLLWPGLTMLVVNSLSDFFLTMMFAAKAATTKKEKTGSCPPSMITDDMLETRRTEINDMSQEMLEASKPEGLPEKPGTYAEKPGAYASPSKPGASSASKLDRSSSSGSSSNSSGRGQVPFLLVGVGGVTSLLLCTVVSQATFNISFTTALMALLMGIILTYVATQAAATTDLNPTGTLAKITKLLFSFVPARSPARRQFLSIAGAMMSTGTSSQCVDLIFDLKLASLCRTALVPQFHAQLFGALLSAPLTTALFALYVRAYPCIIAVSDDDCMRKYGFTMTPVYTWKAFAIATTDPKTMHQLPQSALWACAGLTVTVIACNVIKRLGVPPRWQWLLPQWSAIGVAFLTPRVDYSISVFVGALFSALWAQRAPKAHQNLMYTVASGLIAGEGMWGLVAALLNIGGVSEGWVTRTGLPN